MGKITPEVRIRNFLKGLMLIAILILPLHLANGRTSLPPDTLTIIHVTDIHACNLTGYNAYFVSQRQHLSNNTSTFADFLKSSPRRYNADILVVTGDMIDFYDAETVQGKMLGTQVEQFAGLIEISEIPVYLTLGNHDIASYRVPKSSSYTSDQIRSAEARATWMRNVACFKNGTYYSRIFQVDDLTLRLIFLDNAFIATSDFHDGVQEFIVDPYQLQWLDNELKASQSDIEIIFTHMPLPYGKKVSSSILSEPISTYSSKSKYSNLLTLLEKNSSAKFIFAGHQHVNAINEYIFPNGNKLTQVLTGSFGNEKSNYRIIRITGDNIIISSPGVEKTELTIPLK